MSPLRLSTLHGFVAAASVAAFTLLPGCSSGGGGDASAGNGATSTPGGGDGSSSGNASGNGGDADGGGATKTDGGEGAVGPACDPTRCPSGACAPDGTCAPACSESKPCDGGLTCCGGACVDPAHDARNCGACGNACGASEFCTGVACVATTLANVCANAQDTVVLDGFAIDDEAGKAIGAAIASACSPAPSVRYVAQNGSGVIDGVGRPILGPGDTFVTGGGGYGQRGVKAMSPAAPITVSGTATTMTFVERKTGKTIAEISDAEDPHHDYFVVQLAVEPTSGTLCFSTYGFFAGGTTAGAFYVASTIVPQRASYADAWYVYEWTDTNQSGAADAADAFVKIASGR